MSKAIRIFSLFTLVVIVLAACNLPSNATPTADPNAVFTAAALTVQAQLTQAAPFKTPTLPPPPPATNTAPPTTIPPTAVPPTATALCDQALFVKDVTIPDGTTFPPGATFTKTWRLRNIGTCTWSGYSLVFDSGNSMNGTSPIAIGTVPPGQEVDLSVTLTAPTTPDSYRSYWRIRNASGVLIPVVSGYQGRAFFADIKVVVSSSGFDLHTQATSAVWIGSAGAVTFGGPDTDPNGFVMFRNNQKLEDGSSPGKVLEMHPQWVNDGVMTGTYPSYLVQPGEHFRARIGFLAMSDGTCGAGNVKFQLNYKESGTTTIKPLGEWTETCDGTLRSIDVDLASIAGKNVQFALAVLANGSASQDWAVWVAPEVRIP